MKVMLSLIAVVVLLLVMSSLAMAKPAKPSGSPAPVAPTPAAPAAPVAPSNAGQAQAAAETRAREQAQARAEAVELLGAAGSMRQSGDLGIALELGRQAVGKAPDYAEAKAFVKEVEAQKKAAEEAAKAEETKRQASAAHERAAADRQAFLSLLRTAGAKNDLVIGVDGGLLNRDDLLRVTVGNTWFLMNYQSRLQMAQDMQTSWATIHSPNAPDRAYLELVDRNGNPAGGSDWVGSMVKVPR